MPALMIGVDPEASPILQRDGEIELERFGELPLLIRIEQGGNRLPTKGRRQRCLADRADHAFDLDLDRRSGNEEEIRRLVSNHHLQIRVDIHRFTLSSVGFAQAMPRRNAPDAHCSTENNARLAAQCTIRL